MSDNVQNAPWNKTTTAGAAAAAASIGGNAGAPRLPYTTAPTVLYGGGINSALSSAHPDVGFQAARFQAPSIHQQHVNSPTAATAALPQHLPVSGGSAAVASNLTHHHTTAAPPIASSNVPVYPPTGAATSVLTPNPFVTVSGAPTVAATMPPATRPFALHQFFHAMNTAAAASLVGNTAVATPLNLNTPSPSQIVIPSGMATSPASNSGLSRTTNIDLPSPSSTSSAAGGSGNTLLTSTSVGALTNTITENVLNAISGVSHNAAPARNMGFGIQSAPDEEKLRRVHQMVEANVGEQAKQQIVQILDCISTLKPVEKLLLYLRLPGSAPETDPLRQPQNPLGTRSEINHTINWVRSHLEQDPHVSIPKQDVYNDYIAYCERLDIKPLSTADFGKVMKQVFPGIRPRRLGTRGHSRYCYAAMRKTTKLASPQLPQLGNGSSTNKTSDTSDQGIGDFSNIADPLSMGGTETWSTIKTWAEGLLQIKLDNAKDLAERIKTGNMPGAVGNIAAGGTRMSITHKKFGNRETKEKRLMNDMGPLKKRRKKKRKGSSSSESSYNSQPPIKQSNSDKETLQPTIAAQHLAVAAAAPSLKVAEEESITLVKVKEEILESPTFQRVRHLTPPNRQKGAMGENYLQQQEQQQQMWPINLAPEQRSVLTRAPTTTSAFNAATPRAAAAKNLVPKIIELSGTTVVEPQSPALIPTIKEEEVDEYNTSNILCKKVRKAQQTKGFWQQTTTPVVTIVTSSIPSSSIPVTTIPHSQVVPVITTSAATPTPIEAHQQSVAANTPSPVSNYLMGPPAAASSTSPFSATDSGSVTPTPKVASRNMQQLRAKRFQLNAAAAAAASEANASNPADDLPENLGLPRERVISICNMDKHELDDYFINGEEEEENSNEPDTELLQYFQTGDAEEKLNSLDAGKQRNPTAIAALGNSQPPNVATQQAIQQPVQQSTLVTATMVAATTTTTNIAAQSALPIFTSTAAMTTTLTSAVGSASASLALMSQKHQQVQQLQQNIQHQQQQQHPQILNSVATKRKLLPTKHCTFAPISPNINGSNSNASISVNAPSSTSNGSLFASPGIASTRLRPKPALLAKQHSLDIDLSGAIPFTSPSMTTMHDPMIGASRRRRTYVNATSASAPPSPSILHQQQQQHLFNTQQIQNAANQWLTTTSFLNDQNSIDLDLFVAANGNNTTANAPHYGTGVITGPLSLEEYAAETQRSQSVPLSQLQRIHSPPMGNMSVLGTTVAAKSDFNIGDNSLICSENSSSQHSNPTSAATNSAAATAAIIKLEDPAVSDVLASESAALLDSVDVNEILSSPDFVQNFTSIAHQQSNSITAATTTCSSAGSSSGYSSGACTTFTGGGISGNIMSRSVPSTPLPHHHQNLFGQSSVNFYSQRRRSGITNDELQLSPCSGFTNNTNNKYVNNNNNNHSGSVSFSNTFGSRSVYDISKSMPTTPITTPSFRYSPEFNRDFLINGNTIDDSMSFGAIGSDSLITTGGPNSVSATGDDDSVNLVSNLNPDALLTADDVSVPGADDVLLGNL